MEYNLHPTIACTLFCKYTVCLSPWNSTAKKTVRNTVPKNDIKEVKSTSNNKKNPREFKDTSSQKKCLILLIPYFNWYGVKLRKNKIIQKARKNYLYH